MKKLNIVIIKKKDTKENKFIKFTDPSLLIFFR